MTNSDREVVLDHLGAHAYSYNKDKWHILASRKLSHEYIECQTAFSHPKCLQALGRLVEDFLLAEVRAVGGLTMGADPIAMATSMVTAVHGLPEVYWFSVRKGPKGHGQGNLIEGDIPHGSKVCVLDDVVTSGDSVIRAIESCQAEGLVVVQVIVVVDREDGGAMDKIRRVVGPKVPVSSLFTSKEVADRHRLIFPGAPGA